MRLSGYGIGAKVRVRPSPFRPAVKKVRRRFVPALAS